MLWLILSKIFLDFKLRLQAFVAFWLTNFHDCSRVLDSSTMYYVLYLYILSALSMQMYDQIYEYSYYDMHICLYFVKQVFFVMALLTLGISTCIHITGEVNTS